MVALAVRAVLASGVVDEVVLLDVGAGRDALERACSGLAVSVREGMRHALAGTGTHTGQRPHTTTGDGPVTGRSSPPPADIVLLHDATRPLAPAALAGAVVEAVRWGHAMAVPVLPLSDTVKSVDGDGVVRATPDRSGLRVLQTPIAARAELLTDVAEDPLEPVRRYLAGGGAVHTVPGHPAAFAVRTAWDLELAELLAERTIEP
jgi:2-C-methyl-D-erythritol 4-phosphate cytidylyltransferase